MWQRQFFPARNCAQDSTWSDHLSALRLFARGKSAWEGVDARSTGFWKYIKIKSVLLSYGLERDHHTKAVFHMVPKITNSSTRAGRTILQPTGYHAFIPAPLPPDPPLIWDENAQSLLSEANLALGRLDGIASTLPNPDLFVALYVRQQVRPLGISLQSIRNISTTLAACLGET